MRALAAAWLAVALCAHASQAQSRHIGEANGLGGRPGGQYCGRYIGFEPKHGNVPVPRPPHRRPTGAGQRTAANITQSNYESALETPAWTEDGSVIIEDGATVPYDMPVGHDVSPVAAVANVWGSVEALIFWTKGMPSPALATTSTAETAQEDAGVLGRRTTEVLFGNEEMTDGSRGGGQYNLGFWFTPHRVRALELSYLHLDSDRDRFFGSQDDLAVLARPFFDTVAASEDARLIVFPELVEGSLGISVSTRFDTAEVLVRTPTSRCHGCLDYFFGYRFAQLDDNLRISESTLSLAGPTQGASFLLTDSLETENQFHGGQLGVQFTSQSSPFWSMDLAANVALGNTHSRVSNVGSTEITAAADESTVQNSGLLVQGTNSGTFDSDEFSTITEVGVTIHRHITCNVALNFGYTFLIWTDVVRAGEGLDTAVNTSQIPPGTLDGEARPAVNTETTDFWAQGVRLGLEARF